MSKQKEDVLSYLDVNSNERGNIDTYIRKLEEIVSKSSGGEITIYPADFSALISDAKKITIDYVNYSEITRIIY